MAFGICTICNEKIEDQELPKFYDNPLDDCSIVCFECYQIALLPSHKVQAFLCVLDDEPDSPELEAAYEKMRSAVASLSNNEPNTGKENE